jgi:hypothetical protein
MIAALAFLLCALGGWVLPWWWPAVVGATLSFWGGGRSGRTFWPIVAGTMAAWAGIAAWFQIQNQGLLADKVAVLFQLSDGWALVAGTGLLGGLTAGLAAWTGAAARNIAKRSE